MANFIVSILIFFTSSLFLGVLSTTLPMFPDGAPWTKDISTAELADDSAETITWLGDQGGFGLGRLQIDFSIHVNYANCDTPLVNYTTEYHDWGCDEPAQIPLPTGGAIEGQTDYYCSGGDCHLLVYNNETKILYEAWSASLQDDGSMSSTCLVMWDTSQVYPDDGRGEQCTSADAAGFPMSTLLFTADEVYAGEINHAIRFILPNARMRAGYYVHPASHGGGPSGDSPAPIYGTRLRLKQSYNISYLSTGAQVVATALKKYGMFLADGALTGQSDLLTDHTWDEVGMDSHSLISIPEAQFDVIAYDTPVVLTYDCVPNNISMKYSCDHLPGNKGGGVSPGGKAALVIFLLILPLGIAGAVTGWIVYRKKKQQPILPEKISELLAKIKK